ncbi:hypothetical protein IPH92_01775 [Candidatus Kaiserbacteria bacterium]|nr:MAG: hypothetical protein IPH92_01775 [Candidatus Kaiserbacteria bacterium]
MKHSPEGVPEAKTIPGSMGEYPHLTLEESNTIQLLLIKRYLAKYPKEFNEDLNKAEVCGLKRMEMSPETL